MARTATTADVFNAIGDQRRRDILVSLGGGEHDVTALVDRLRRAQPQDSQRPIAALHSGPSTGQPEITQPLVSKHLKVLRDVDLVRCRQTGKRRLYRVNAEALKPVHAFTAQFEQMWNERLDRLDDVLHEMQEMQRGRTDHISNETTGQPTGRITEQTTDPEERSET